MSYNKKFFSDMVKDGPFLVTVVSVGQPDPQDKWGRPPVTFKIQATGAEHTEKVFTSHLSVLKPGAQVEVFANDKGYADFRPTSAGEQRSNTKDVKRERQVTKTIKDNDQSRDVHDWKLGIAGMLQSYRAGGDFTDEAREKAVADAKWIRDRAVIEASGDVVSEVFDIPEPPQPSVDVSSLPF